MLPQEISRRRFDVEEYHRMGEIGLLTEDDRVELIRGELVEMNPIGVAHMSVVTTLTRLLSQFAYGNGMEISVQNPIAAADESEPEPDIALITAGPRTELPSSADTFVIIEVSDTTLDYDRNVKLPLYAETGILEVWIVDLKGKKVEVHSNPDGDLYREKRTFGAGEEIISATLDGLKVPVDEVLA